MRPEIELEATFGGVVFSHDLINDIGGGDDTNANLTDAMFCFCNLCALAEMMRIGG